jgi:hypothetical protein
MWNVCQQDVFNQALNACDSGFPWALSIVKIVSFGGLFVSVLAIGSKVRMFRPGRGRILKGDKNP